MAHNVKIAAAVANAMLEAFADQVAGDAVIEIYSGTQPATPETAVTDQVLLASLTCAAVFEASVSGGVLALGDITEEDDAPATGTATWFRLKTSGGVAKLDGTVGVGSAYDLRLSTTAIVEHATVSIDPGSITMPLAAS